MECRAYLVLREWKAPRPLWGRGWGEGFLDFKASMVRLPSLRPVQARAPSPPSPLPKVEGRTRQIAHKH
jgi:hypothetical protein